MTMQEIVSTLAEIQNQLNAIDLTKDKSVKEIKNMGKTPLQRADKLIHDKNFEEGALESTVNMFKTASQKVEQYDSKQEREKAIGDKAKRSEILAKVKAKEEVKKEIKAKYEELNRKKAVIDKYKEKFDPEHLVKREQRRIDINKDRMKTNEARIREIADFKDKVSDELTEISNANKLVIELSDLDKQYQKLEDAKADFNAEKAKPDADKDFIAQYQEHIDNQETKFKNEYKRITSKYPTVSLDLGDLKTSIQNTVNNQKQKISSAVQSIDSKVIDSEKKYGYTQGFEKFLTGKLNSAQKVSDYPNIFNEASMELEAENMNLDYENENIEDNMQTIRRGQRVIEQGQPTVYSSSYEPTEEEIQDEMSFNPEVKALAPYVPGEERRQATYEYLTKDKKGKFHPILFLKSFSKAKQEEWKTAYEKDARKKAIENLKNERRESAVNNSRAVNTIDSKRQKFMDSLFTRVMKADNKTVEEMDKNADKKPGKVLTEVYDEMEKDDGSR